MRILPIAITIPLLVLGACGSDDDDPCDPIAQTGCDDGLICETVQGGDEPTACFGPVVLRGAVFDVGDGTGIEGARVVAFDINGAAVTAVAITDENGDYELVVPSARVADGSPLDFDVTLRAAAAGYQQFPSGFRQALPISIGSAAVVDEGFVVMSALTDIGLIELPAGAGDGIIRGTVEIPDDGNGVLVVAEGGGGGLGAIADRDGDYVIFNVPAGGYDVAGFSQGVNYDRASIDLGAGETVDVDLSINGSSPTELAGRVSLVNPGDGQATSVVLMVASTFDPISRRGLTPPGLRAPEPGAAPNITGAWTIPGVPDGHYVILASFENDALVRDPDTCIAGTDIVEQTVAGDGTILIDDAFKVTGSLDIIGPGAQGAELITGNPTFEWGDDSSEDEYWLTVVNALGDIVWEHTAPGESGNDPSVPYAGPALESGMYYQFRVVSVRKPGGGSGCEISATEDLKGVFYLE